MPLGMLESNRFICLLLAVSILRIKDLCGVNANRTVDGKHKIVELQCYARCFKLNTETGRDICVQKCKVEITKSPRLGRCPSFIQSNNIETCINACKHDFDCPETQKCCASTCGPVCQNAVGLDKESSLPPIPQVLGFKLPKGQRVCEVTIQAPANSGFVYHIEARHHVGTLFSPRKLGGWETQALKKIADIFENKTKRIGISFKLKPGRWYEFRVAAINANGFRGYTEPSKPFALPNHPKPPKSPPNLQVLSPRIYSNGSLSLKVGWCPPKSDLPIERYKVSWALYVRSEYGSLSINNAFIKDATQFEIPELIFDSCYYIQVQAISINGRRRLKSEKVSLLYNTTLPLEHNEKLQCSMHRTSKEIFLNGENNMLEDHATKPIRNTSNYEIKFRPSKKFGMIVQISGFHPQRGRLIEICAGDVNCENHEYGAIRPKKDLIEFGKLKFDTVYTIRTIDLNGSAGKESENDIISSTKQFTTPKCENWRKRFPKINVDC